jgi:diguanylate cyclase (GGDEF)-like protein
VATIVVVDDRPTNLEFLTTLIGYTGHKAIEAADGAAALELVQKVQPDLMITDILMPTMNGYELVEQLRGMPQFAKLPIIFYTATYRASEAERLAAACGVTMVLAKPAEPQQILAAIQSALGGGPPVKTAQPPEPINATEPEQGGFAALFRHYLDELDALMVSLPPAATGKGSAAASAGERLRDVGDRIYRMARLCVELCAERDSVRILERLLAAIAGWVGADDGAICAIDARDPSQRHVRTLGGVRPEWYATASSESVGLLRALVRENRTMRLQAKGGAIEAMGLVSGHPPVGSFLGTPLTNRTETVGWLYLTRRPGKPAFDDEDEFLAHTLASNAAILYENAHLFDVVQRHAADLQLEVTERRHAEAQVRRLNRLLGVLTSINNLIVRTRNRDELFAHACRILVEQGQYLGAWIGLVTDGRIVPGAWHGTMVLREPALHPDSGPRAAQAMWSTLESGKPYVCNDLAHELAQEVMPANERNAVVLALAAVPITIDGKTVGALTVNAGERDVFNSEELRCLDELAHDIAFAMEFIAREEKLGFLSRHDPLTGLANRTLLEERLVEHIAEAQRDKERVGVMVVDLDRFKAVNDRLGYVTGDDVLRRFASRLAAAAGDATRIARISGDRYAVVVPGLREPDEIGRVLRERINDVFDEPMKVGEEDIKLSAKLGIAIYPDDCDTGEGLIRNAEAALKRAKSTGERYLFYTQQMSDAMKRRMSLEGRLQQALTRNEFVLHYQPQIELRSGVIRGAEALIRWANPELGLVPPGHFIPLLEETGLIIDVGLWVVEQANRDHRYWQGLGLQAPRVSVNVSTMQLRQADFVDRLKGVLGDNSEPHGIDIELTESLMMTDIEASIAKLRAIRDMGATVSIDDFGTGFSSLAYLARLPIGTIKIDRSFVVRMTNSADDMSIVSTIIALAHSMNMKVIAEGVDSREQLKTLRLLNCDEVQGFLFSPAVPTDDFVALLKRGFSLPA